MGRSPYVDDVVLSPKHSGKRTHKVQAFVIHHMMARWTGRRCAKYLRDTPSREASANYNIGYDGDVAISVEEENRAWTSSSAWADNRAITYELANESMGFPWYVSKATIDKLILMLAEQHKRYGLRASYTGDTSGTLWRHDWFTATTCPGPYLASKLPYIADEVNKILDKKPTVAGTTHKPVEKPKPSAPQSSGIVSVEEETGSFKANDTILVRDRPSTSGKHIATYQAGEVLQKYVRIHKGNGYLWLEYERKGTPSKGFIPVRTYDNGKYGELWGEVRDVGGFDRKEKTYIHLKEYVPSWKVYPLGVAPIASNSKRALSPSLFKGGLTYEIKGYEDNGGSAVIDTQDYGRVKIWIDGDARIYKDY